MRSLRVVAVVSLVAVLCPLSFAQSVYTTGFESPGFSLGDVAGQNGWGHLSNSYTRGEIEPVPIGSPATFGSQSLALRTRNTANLGVTNHLYSATISPGAGEIGSTAGGVVVANPQRVFRASFWYRVPALPVISTRADGRFAELDPSSKGSASGDAANRYAQVRVFNSTNTIAGVPRVEMRWFTSTITAATTVATLNWGEWYRFDYLILLADGTDGAEPNDRFTLTISNSAGTQIGRACGSTWELGWKSGTFGGGSTPRVVNGFDFWSLTGPNDALVGHIDRLTMTAEDDGGPVQVAVSGTTNVCFGGTTMLTAVPSGGTGTFTSVIWRDASNAAVGSGNTFVASAGSYTVTATDSLCVTGTAAVTVTSEDPLVASIGGNTNVCFGGTTTLTASATGGSGTITGYEWRDASNTVIGTSSTLTAPAGTYTVTITDASCGTDTSNEVTVQTTCPATPVVTWSNPATIVYGTPLSSTQLNATASVPGTFTYTPPAGTVLPAGANQTLSVDFTPTDSTNYSSVNGTTVVITVEKAPTTITIDGTSPRPSYEGQPVDVRFTVGGLIGSAGGAVTITDGIDSCTTSVTSASCTLALTTRGQQTLTATYSGDVNHLGSTSAGFVQRVEPGPPTATVDGSRTICEGDSAVIRARFTGDGPWTITWSDGLTETIASSQHRRTVTPSVTRTYRIVSVRDQNRPGSESGVAVVSVIAIAPPVITGNPIVSLGERVTLRATPGYAAYQWFRNGVAIAGATSEQFTIAAVTRVDLATYTVSGARDNCLSLQSAAITLALQPPIPPLSEDAIIPVVGTVRGAGGSSFRTTLHLTNGTNEVLGGEITFLDERLPNFEYLLAPGETRFVEDLLPPTYTGLTSANLRRLRGPLPVAVVHVFNDEAQRGTTGMIERPVPIGATLGAGDRAVLVTPIDPVATRFNVGLRSLGDGLVVRIVRRDAFGLLLGTSVRTVPPSTLIHEPFATLLGAAPGSSESLTFEIVSGRGVIYGAATDNGTNDPNLQVAEAIAPLVGETRFLLPVAGSGPGNFGSHFATGLQVHNPGDEPLDASLRFTAPGKSPATHEIVVAPRATLAIADIVAEMHASGFGSLELTTNTRIAPVLLARIYSIDAAGQTSLMTGFVREAEALRVGEEGVIVAPHAPQESRFNIGLRTLGAGARITATIRDAQGTVRHVVALSYGPNVFVQDAAPVLLGTPFTGDESISFRIDEGSAVIYGVWTDNVTQDPAMQYAVLP